MAPQSYQKFRREAFWSSFNIVRKERRSKSITALHDASTLDCIWLNDGRLKMWKVSNWQRLWSVSSSENEVYFSCDCFRVFAVDERKRHAYDAWSGNALDEVDSILESMYDHVHLVIGEVQGKWKCAEGESSLSKKGEYWFMNSVRFGWSENINVFQSAWYSFLLSTTSEILKPVKVT